MYLTVPSFMTEHMGVRRFFPGMIKVFWTKKAADRTGQRTGYPVASCVFLSILLPLFWSLKVRETAWACRVPGYLNSLLSCCTPKNCTFGSLISCVLLYTFLPLGTRRIYYREKSNDGKVCYWQLYCSNGPLKQLEKEERSELFSCFVADSLFL